MATALSDGAYPAITEGWNGSFQMGPVQDGQGIPTSFRQQRRLARCQLLPSIRERGRPILVDQAQGILVAAGMLTMYYGYSRMRRVSDSSMDSWTKI